MQIDRETIMKAKEKLGDRNAEIIIQELGVTDYDEKNMRCCCPFHREDHASFIYDKKSYQFHCFGACQRGYDILDVFMTKGMTFVQACQKLFELADIPYSFGELGVKTRRQYQYPQEVVCTDKSKVYAYFALRKISQETLDYADVRQDLEGNAVFNYYDTNDVLTMVKYRPARQIRRGENKCWCQRGADTTPLLFNMNRINTTTPLLICEGEPDCLAAIESGFTNAVSVPLGSGNFHWIEENWEWLEQFDSIIICSDNDAAGLKMQKECLYRLGSWRTKVVEIPQLYVNEETQEKRKVNDLNEVLYFFGKEKVLEIILNAKESPVPGLIDFSDVKDVNLDELDGIPTGMPCLDRYLMKLFYGTLNIVTGINGCVSGDTEYFNGVEWKPISQYTEGEKVLQYNPDGTAELVIPTKYHKYPCAKFWRLISQYGVDQMVSDEHNIVYITSKGNLAKKPAFELVQQHNCSKNGFQGKFITTYQYDGIGIAMTDDEIRLMCAVVCDGSIISRVKSESLCRVNLKKERKKERLKKLLDAVGIPYQEHQYNPRDLAYRTFLFVPPIQTKAFGANWYQCSHHQLQVIADEILFWDGHETKTRRNFSTTDKGTADFVQFVFSATGKRAVIYECDRTGQTRGNYTRKSVEYTVTITDQIHPTIFNVKNRREIPSVDSPDGYKYCFTAPSGMLVLRHNGRINVTGNSGKSSFLNQIICQCLDTGENVYLFSGELQNFQTKNWIDFIFAGQRNVSEHTARSGAVYYKVTPEAKREIDNYYRGRLFIRQDGESNKASDLLKSIEDSVRKYGTKLVILDNLTAINLESTDQNRYDKQADLVINLIQLAVKYNVVVILVVHPHKVDTVRRLNKMDVQGISAIIDLAHRILSLYRVSEKDKKGEMRMNGGGWKTSPIKEDVIIDILKDRFTGYENQHVGVFYDRPSRRFFTTEAELDHQYAWDKKRYQAPLPFPPPQLYEDAEKAEEDEVFGRETDRGGGS